MGKYRLDEIPILLLCTSTDCCDALCDKYKVISGMREFRRE